MANWERMKVMTKLERKRYLSFIAKNAEKDSDKLRAIETLSKICGDYQPSKQELKSNITLNITKDDLDI